MSEQHSAEIDAATLRLAADALEAQPPMLRAQYVRTLRLYADEPWRLTGGGDPRTHRLAHAPLGDGALLAPGFCAGCDAERTRVTPPGECDNYLPPLTCLTAPSSEAARCNKCRTRVTPPGSGEAS